MEATWVWAGIAMSGLLLVPVVLDFFKRNLPVFFGISITLLTLYLLQPYSPGIRSFWASLQQTQASAMRPFHS